MSVPRIYLETTMFNFFFSEKESEKKKDTRLLFERITAGWFEPYTSNIVLKELKKAQTEHYRKMTKLLFDFSVNVVTASTEARELADRYVAKGIIPFKYYNDAMHIAIATVNRLNFVASYNFGHIVKLKTLNMAGLVNVRLGYPQIGLFSPTEVKDDDGR